MVKPALAYRGEEDEVRPFRHAGAQAAKSVDDLQNEITLAKTMGDRHSGHIRYVDQWGSWKCWTGELWCRDLTLEVRRLASEIVSEASDRLKDDGKAGDAKRLGRYATVTGVLKLAQADARIAATTDQWDADPMLLNTPAGIVDLRTGDVSSSDPAAYCSKITGTSPAYIVPDDCLWLCFLRRICDGREDLVAYLQRALGYSLTGKTVEEVLFFLFGTGANGKSKLLEAIAGVLGDYHEAASMESFVASKFDQHPTDLAKLRGARFVSASETEEGRRWSEAKIKSITGGDAISARFMRQDFFTFRPQLKLWVAGNHKPSVRSVDQAMRRRLQLIPFTVTIPEEERDKDLSEKLKAEWPIILRWMIEGCLEWQRVGLQPPECVRVATDAYLAAEDVFGTWLAECTIKDPRGQVTTKDLWASWKKYVERTDERSVTMKRFSQLLQERGYEHGKDRYGSFYNGLGLLEEVSP